MATPEARRPGHYSQSGATTDPDDLDGDFRAAATARCVAATAFAATVGPIGVTVRAGAGRAWEEESHALGT